MPLGIEAGWVRLQHQGGGWEEGGFEETNCYFQLISFDKNAAEDNCNHRNRNKVKEEEKVGNSTICQIRVGRIAANETLKGFNCTLHFAKTIFSPNQNHLSVLFVVFALEARKANQQ